MKTFTVPADGQWHRLGPTTSILAPNTVTVDIDFDGIGWAFNHTSAPVEIEYQERRPDAVSSAT